jgi:hypothetical protein
MFLQRDLGAINPRRGLLRDGGAALIPAFSDARRRV